MHRILVSAAFGVLAVWPAALIGQTSTLTCDQRRRGDDEGERVCEIRELPVAMRSDLTVDGGPNGGIRVQGWDRNEIRLWARVEARASSEADARDLMEAVEIATDGTVRASGPRTRHREWWTVTFEVFVPRATNLDLETTNGGVRIAGVQSRVRFAVTNGGVRLRDLGGDVSGRTTNGGVALELSGDAWDGAGVDVRTTNGGVQVLVPEGYNAHLVTGTTNGGLSFDFPVTVQGRINRRLETDLGSGGATIRAVTTNGSVHIRRPSS